MEATPENVARVTRDMTDNNSDIADQADRLTMIMDAEAARNGARGVRVDSDRDGPLGDYAYPLEDVEDTLAEEGAEDASDDPMHAGGLNSSPWIPAENAAMHVMGTNEYASDETNEQKSDPNFDQYSESLEGLTPEDATLLGIDPYEH